jgi:hypothetical protein
LHNYDMRTNWERGRVFPPKHGKDTGVAAVGDGAGPLLLLARRLSLQRVGHEASVGSFGDKGMPWSHNLKAQKAEGSEQGGYRENMIRAHKTLDTRGTPTTQDTCRNQRPPTARGSRHSPSGSPFSFAPHPVWLPVHHRHRDCLPLSSRFLWKQMKTWSAWSCSSANSSRTAKLKHKQHQHPVLRLAWSLFPPT